jgi:hypothetical protein
MKVQRCDVFQMHAYSENGKWVKASDAERLEKRVEELEKENSELRARIDAYLEAQKPKECAPPVCGTLCTACEEAT